MGSLLDSAGARLSLRRRARDRQLRHRPGRWAGAAAHAGTVAPALRGRGRLGLICALAASAVASTPQGFVASHQGADGGFAESGRQSDPTLTAWSALGLRAAGAPTGAAADYLAAHTDDLRSAT